MTVKTACARIVAARWFERGIVALILLNAVALGMETSVVMQARFGPWLLAVNQLVLVAFVLEAAVKITAVAPRWRRYFGDGWNVFDFSVVVLSLVPATGQLALIARTARLLRVLRLVSTVPELRLIVSTLLRSLPGLGHVVMLLAVIFYLYAVAGCHLLHEHDPLHWGSLGLSLLTLFRVLTLEDWTDVMYAAMEHTPMMWLYFVSFIITATFVVINLFIAVVINNLEEAKKEWFEGGGRAVDEGVGEELRALRLALERLEQRLAASADGARPRAGAARADVIE